jgi:hypothetical protein
VGTQAVLGVSASPLRHVVRVGGSAYRIAVNDLSAAVAEIPALRAMLLSYLHVALMQSSQSAACGLRHSFPQRLARWLLTAQDRTGSDEVPVTQDLLARALGVRRATVSEAIKAFERKGVLGRLRGLIRPIGVKPALGLPSITEQFLTVSTTTKYLVAAVAGRAKATTKSAASPYFRMIVFPLWLSALQPSWIWLLGKI